MRLLAALGLVVLVAACGTEPPPAEELPPPMPVARAVPVGVADLVSAADAFGLDLLAAPTLADQTNLVVSPISASLALRMAGAGAKGETAAQLAKVLHLPTGPHPRLPDFDRTSVRVSNTAWAQRGLRLKADYLTALRTQFDARLREADFLADPDDARGLINDTVADQTAGKITDLFPRDSISHDTRLVLTNALYLKADWAREFPATRTREAPFTRADGSTVPVQMMRNDPDRNPPAPLGYAEGSGYQAVTVPYRGGRLAFTVIVPASLEALRAKGIAALLDEVRPARVALAMPRFTAGSELNLTETLAAAGTRTAFTDAADFSGITDDAELRIDSVRHRTLVQIDEKGTEAAAATGVDMQVVSAPQTRTVTVDRPFVFVITDTATGAPLFLGRVADPTSSRQTSGPVPPVHRPGSS